MRSASARALAAAALVAVATAVPAGGAIGSSGRAAAVQPSWTGGTFRTSTGESVTVHVSTAYAPERVSPQAWAELFAGLPHGSELATVVVRVAAPPEVAELCGDGALGCYRSSELVIPGEAVDGVAPDEIARHEYGHHVAASRSNPPWNSSSWGPKRWATAAGVCPRARLGTAFPGDDGTHYRLDPAEAFAESYRVLAGRRAGAPLDTWGLVDQSFFPSAAVLGAVEQDVVRPWTAPTTTRERGRFTRTAKPTRLTRISTPLDGVFTAELRLPAGRLDTLELVGANGRVLARGLWSGSRTRRLSYVVCGQRTLSLRVALRGAPGRFDLVVTRP
jgi:hypothetical protein